MYVRILVIIIKRHMLFLMTITPVGVAYFAEWKAGRSGDARFGQ